MSQVGKTLLRGHGLLHEGQPRYRSDGSLWTAWWVHEPSERCAKCRCGAVSQAGISQSAAKRWHREHKDSLR